MLQNFAKSAVLCCAYFSDLTANAEEPSGLVRGVVRNFIWGEVYIPIYPPSLRPWALSVDVIHLDGTAV